MKKLLSILTPLFLIISSVLSGCGGATGENANPTASAPILAVDDSVITSSAEVSAETWASLAFMVGAQNVEIKARVGDKVKKGETLASIPDSALPQSLINAQADLVLAQQSLDDLLASKTALAQAAIELRVAQDAYDKAFDYRDSLNYQITITEVTTKEERTPTGVIEVPVTKKYEGYATQTMIAKADEDLALKKGLLDDAQRNHDRLANIENSPDVIAAKTRIAAIEAVLSQAKLFAPFDGVVVETYLNSGEMVSPGAPVILLADLSALQVQTTDLNEVDAARVQIGDPVSVTFDALPDVVVAGKVSNVSLKNAAGAGVYFNVTISLEEIPAQLRWGMSAFAEIKASK
ncbi:MAG: efflux RND transporter periplasmic adaptor subunit [Anaerolineales bacterium]|nr:efflux RND transporter periplasmic adaptor subunit [Anaerolineales bacterium]